MSNPSNNKQQVVENFSITEINHSGYKVKFNKIYFIQISKIKNT